jgi:uncharacterized protein
MRQPDFVSAMKKVNPAAAAKALHIPAMRAVDIIRELCNPGLDPRDSLDGPLLKSDILKIEDLTPGMQLQGTVRNVTSFGAFVDIGLHENGLVHISKMASNYVKDPKDVVRTGQIVTVYVVQADPVRKRISLSLVPVN